MVPLLYPVLLFLLFACALAFPFHVLCRLPLFVGTLSVSHVVGASVVCSCPLGYFSLLNFFPFMVTNFNGNSKITLLPFITLPFLAVFGHAQSLDVSYIYLLCHIFSLWIVFTFLIPSFTFSLIVLSLMAPFVIGEIFHGLFFFFFFFLVITISGSLVVFLFPLKVFCFQSWFIVPWGILSLSMKHTHGMCCAVLSCSVVSDSL